VTKGARNLMSHIKESEVSNKMNELMTLEEFKYNVEEAYEYELDDMDIDLMFVDSYTRGALLNNIINESSIEIKYYLLIKWWGLIDDGHSLFNVNDVEEWLSFVKVKLDLSDLNYDAEGYVTVYRGENQNSNSHKNGAFSWTTSSSVAEGFARGLRERTIYAKKPILITGKVHKSKILGRLDGREEFELLCKDVSVHEEKKLRN